MTLNQHIWFISIAVGTACLLGYVGWTLATLAFNQ